MVFDKDFDLRVVRDSTGELLLVRYEWVTEKGTSSPILHFMPVDKKVRENRNGIGFTYVVSYADLEKVSNRAVVKYDVAGSEIVRREPIKLKTKIVGREKIDDLIRGSLSDEQTVTLIKFDKELFVAGGEWTDLGGVKEFLEEDVYNWLTDILGFGLKSRVAFLKLESVLPELEEYIRARIEHKEYKNKTKLLRDLKLLKTEIKRANKFAEIRLKDIAEKKLSKAIGAKRSGTTVE